MSSGGSGRSRKRRSTRFKLKIPLAIEVGGGLSLDGETTCVSKHGAHIRVRSTSRQLSHGDTIQVVLRARQQAHGARVVWVDPTGAPAFAIELEQGGDLWGIRFPGSTGEQWRPAARSSPPAQNPVPPVSPNVVPVKTETAVPVVAKNAAQVAPVPPSPPQEHAAPPAPKEESTPALPATITGFSAVRLPVSESVEVVFNAPNEAHVLLRNLVEPGAMLRLLLANGRVVMARVASIGGKREAGKWRVRIICDAPAC